MKKCIILVTGLMLGLVAMGQTYLTHQNGYKSAYLLFESTMISAFDVHENLIFTSDVDTIRMLDMDSGTLLRKFEKPEDDTVSVSASFLTISPEGTSIWAGYTSSSGMDDRIYHINIMSGIWKHAATFPKNFDLVFWKNTILVSGIGINSSVDPNGIFVLDTSGMDLHRMLIETGGYSAGMDVGPEGDLYYGTSYAIDPNGLYRWDSARVAGALTPGTLDTLLISDAEKISDLPAGAYDCDVDKAGNLVFNMNESGGMKVLARWNGTLGDGINLDTLAGTSGEGDWMALLKTVGDITLSDAGNRIITFSFGEALADVHAADYHPCVASPIPDITMVVNNNDTIIDISRLFTDPDDPDTLILKEVIFNSAEDQVQVSVVESQLAIHHNFMMVQKSAIVTAEIVLEGNSAGLIVTDTLLVSIEDITGTKSHSPDEVVVSPNPTTGSFRIEAARATVAEVKVYNLTGRVVLQQENYLPGEIIDISDQPRGAYILKAVFDGRVVSKLIQRQ